MQAPALEVGQRRGERDRARQDVSANFDLYADRGYRYGTWEGSIEVERVWASAVESPTVQITGLLI
jgi:hypothetical protein